MKQQLPVGYYRFSKNNFFNYQLNRWYSLGYTRFEDIKIAGQSIKTIGDNKRIFSNLAEAAIKDNRLKNAAFYYRAAEFLTNPWDEDKLQLYKKFSETFYDAFEEFKIERHKVKYRDSFLSAMRLGPIDSQYKGTVVIHGGFDSFIEEFFCYWRHFAEKGYEVVAFDGPGQGATLNFYKIPHDHDWEKPVKAILDYFNLDDVTLVGISFGGYWCLRAAAFEKRIKRVIVHGPLYDLLEGSMPIVRKFLDIMMKSEKFMNTSIRVRMKFLPVINHVVNHCLHINNKTGAEPIEAVRWLLGMNKEHLHSDLVDQDVLLLAGEKDRFQSVKLYHKQMQALVNARSLTGRIFTEKENAQNHCQMGNLGLALNVMSDWLDEL